MSAEAQKFEIFEKTLSLGVRSPCPDQGGGGGGGGPQILATGLSEPEGRGEGAWPPKFWKDWGQIMLITTWPPPDFQTFLTPCYPT